MSADRKVTHKFYMAWNYDQEEKELDRMSREGWQLEEGGCFHSTFIRDEQKRYRHKLDFNPDAMKSEESRTRYISAFEDGGWEFVSSTYNGWIFLRKPEGLSEEEYEIYSDRESMMGLFRRFERLGKLLSLVLVLMALAEVMLAADGAGVSGVAGAVILVIVLVWVQLGMRRLKRKQENFAGRMEK